MRLLSFPIVVILSGLFLQTSQAGMGASTVQANYELFKEQQNRLLESLATYAGGEIPEKAAFDPLRERFAEYRDHYWNLYQQVVGEQSRDPSVQMLDGTRVVKIGDLHRAYGKLRAEAHRTLKRTAQSSLNQLARLWKSQEGNRALLEPTPLDTPIQFGRREMLLLKWHEVQDALDRTQRLKSLLAKNSDFESAMKTPSHRQGWTALLDQTELSQFHRLGTQFFEELERLRPAVEEIELQRIRDRAHALASATSRLQALPEKVAGYERAFSQYPRPDSVLAGVISLQDELKVAIEDYRRNSDEGEDRLQHELQAAVTAFDEAVRRIVKKIASHIQLSTQAAALSDDVSKLRANVRDPETLAVYALKLRELVNTIQALSEVAALSVTQETSFRDAQSLASQAGQDLAQLESLKQLLEGLTRVSPKSEIRKVLYLIATLGRTWGAQTPYSLLKSENLRVLRDTWVEDAAKLSAYLEGLRGIHGSSQIAEWKNRLRELQLLRLDLHWMASWNAAHPYVAEVGSQVKRLETEYAKLSEILTQGEPLLARYFTLSSDVSLSQHRLYVLKTDASEWIQSLRRAGYLEAARQMELRFAVHLQSSWLMGTLLNTCQMGSISDFGVSAFSGNFRPEVAADQSASLTTGLIPANSAIEAFSSRIASSSLASDGSLGESLEDEFQRIFSATNFSVRPGQAFASRDDGNYRLTSRVLSGFFGYRRESDASGQANSNAVAGELIRKYLTVTLRHHFLNHLLIRLYRTGQLDISSPDALALELKRFLGFESGGVASFHDYARSRRGHPMNAEVAWDTFERQIGAHAFIFATIQNDGPLLQNLTRELNSAWQKAQVEHPGITLAEFIQKAYSRYHALLADIGALIHPQKLDPVHGLALVDLSQLDDFDRREVSRLLGLFREVARVVGPLAALGHTAYEAILRSGDQLSLETFSAEFAVSWLNLFKATEERPHQFIRAVALSTPRFYFEIAKQNPAFFAMTCDINERAYHQILDERFWAKVTEDIRWNLATGAMIVGGIAAIASGGSLIAPTALAFSAVVEAGTFAGAAFGLAELAATGAQLHSISQLTESYEALARASAGATGLTGENEAAWIGQMATQRAQSLRNEEAALKLDLLIGAFVSKFDIVDIAHAIRSARTGIAEVRNLIAAPTSPTMLASPTRGAIGVPPSSVMPSSPSNASRILENPLQADPANWKSAYSFPGARSGEPTPEYLERVKESTRKLSTDLASSSEVAAKETGQLLQSVVDAAGTKVRQVDPNSVNTAVLRRRIENPNAVNNADLDFHVAADPRYPALEIVTDTEVTLYRVSGGKAGAQGSFLIPFDPSILTEKQLRELLAAPDGNIMTSVTKVTLPKGSTFTVSRAAPNAYGPGGALQVTIDPASDGFRWTDPEPLRFQPASANQ